MLNYLIFTQPQFFFIVRNRVLFMLCILSGFFFSGSKIQSTKYLAFLFISNANELRTIWSAVKKCPFDIALRSGKKNTKKQWNQKCHWKARLSVDYSILVSCCVRSTVEKKAKFNDERQLPNRRQKFNRAIFLENVWRMEYQSKVERKIKHYIECIWFSIAPSSMDFFVVCYFFCFLLLIFRLVGRSMESHLSRASTHFHESYTIQHIQNMIIPSFVRIFLVYVRRRSDFFFHLILNYIFMGIKRFHFIQSIVLHVVL